MKFKAIIKYIYGESVGKPTQPELARIHQINEHSLLTYLEDNEYIITRDDLVAILKKDGADFHADSIRIYDEKYKCYFEVPEDFELEIDPNQQSSVEMFLLIRSNNVSYHEKVNSLETALETVKVDIEKINAKIDSILNIQKILYDNQKKSSQLMQTPPLQASKSSRQSTIATEVEVPERPNALPSAAEEEKLDELDELELAPVADLRKQNSVIKYIEGDEQLENLQPRTLDLAIIYSEPLVRKVGKNYESLGDPVDYEEECTKLLDILQAKKKKIDLIFEIASHDRLVSLLAKGPIILHIICHGEYNKERKQFYLCFEADNGELYEFYSENLSDIVRNVELKVKLVFVNACHSEEVAKVFVQAGVPCVIAIQSELKIADNVAQKFSHHFYDQIFDGKSIKEAFDLAKVASRSADTQTCCCAHAHKEDCVWYNNYAKIEGFHKAHQLHVPLCTDCKKRNQHIHRSKCPWAEGFLLDFEVNCTSCPNLAPNEIYTCCCSPELPHDESLKFKNICTPDAEKMILFPQRELGKVVNKNPYSVIEQKFPVKRIYGRNRELFQMYDYIIKQDQKFVQLNGSEGVGKTSLVKQLANYLYERGHFRDKVSIIMMEKTPSLSHFLSDLYKEIPGSYDFKSFCESIKLNKMLFILEKCDLLLENQKDEFIDHLRQISHSAKHVKFIIVKNKKERLHLDESEVMIEDLAPLDAAKILLATAFDYLLLDDRRADFLAKRRLFTEIKFTPQRIWCISERLKHHEDLSAIEAEFLANKDIYTSKADANKQDIIVTFQTIKSVDQPCYELLLAVGLFSSGLSTDDLNELSALGMIPENWKIIMKRLTRNPSEIETLNNDIEDQKATQEQWDKQSDYQLLIPGNYFWVVITKDPAKEILHYQPAQFVNKFIDSNLKTDVAGLDLYKLQYLTLLSLSIMKRLKGLYFYHEKSIEHSCISHHGLWMYRQDNTFFKQFIKDRRHYTFIDEFQEGPKALDILMIKKVFEAHESNFLSCLESETILSIVKSDGSLYGEVLDMIEIAWISIPTLYKLFAASEAGARDLCLRTLKNIDDLEYRDSKLSILRAKLHLFLASLHIHERHEYTNAFHNINTELDSVAKIQEEIQKDEVHMALSHHITFTRAYVYWKIRTGRFLQNEKLEKKKHLMKKSEEILQMLKQCDDFLSPLGEFYDVERCKIALLNSKITLKNLKTRRGIEVKITERIKAAIGVFNVYNLKRLEISANYQFALIRFNLKRYSTSKTDSNTRQIKLADSLTQAKNHYLIRNALQIAKLINDKAFETKIKRLVDDINTEIRQGYFNVLILMRAAPIVEVHQKQLHQDHQKGETETKAIGFPTRVSSFYKHDLLKALNFKKKVLYLKFEILTKANVIDSLYNGCRIMQINCNIVQSGGVVLEDSIGRADFIPYSELKSMFSPKNSNQLATTQTPANPSNTQNPSLTPQPSNVFTSEHFLELLILGSKNDFSTANFFADEIKIPHVIYFKFVNKEFDFRHKMYEDHCIDRFCEFFLEDIVDGYSIREAFNRAYERTFDSLSEAFFESRDNTYIKNIIGEGPMMLPDNADHSEVLYGIEDFTLNDGRIEDISTVRYPTNISKTILPYTGRNNDIFAAVKLLVSLKIQFVKFTGEPGIGKTAFALQTGHFLLTRNVFPDGIFYFPLKNTQNQDLKDMMKETFGPKFENNMKNFFRESKMLLIFDDFDIYYTKGQDFPRLIFLTLRECEIATLAITTLRKKQEIMTKKKWQQEYDMRQKAIEDEFLRTERILKPMKDEEMAHMSLSIAKIDKSMDIDIERIKSNQGIKLAEGNPRVLINSLIEKKIMLDKKVLEINPAYVDYVNLDQNLSISRQNPNTSVSKPGGIQRHSSISDSVKLSKMTSTASIKSANSRDSLPSLKLNNRTKSLTGQGTPGKHSQEERKDREKAGFGNATPSITEVHLEKSYERSDDDLVKSSKRGQQKSKLSTTKLRREKSYGSNSEHISEHPKKDSSVSEEKDKSLGHHGSHEYNAMEYYYEEQKSNDADDLLRELGSNDDERDEVYRISMDETAECKYPGSDLEEDESELLDGQGEEDGDDDEVGYFSEEEPSLKDDIAQFAFEKPPPGSRQGEAPEGASRNKTKNSTMKKKVTNQKENSETGNKKKHNNKGQKSGKQAGRFTKTKKNKFVGNQGSKRRESTGSNEED